MRKLSGLLILLIMLTSFSKESKLAKDYVLKVFKKYENTQEYSLKLTYRLYKGSEIGTPTQVYKSLVLKSFSDMYRQMPDMEIYNYDTVSVKLDHELREVEVSKNETSSVVDFEYRAIFNILEKIDIVSSNSGYKIKCYVKNDNSVPFSRIDLEINKQYQILKTVYYYASLINFGTFYKPEYKHPVLSVSFDEFIEKKVSIPQGKLNNYISIDENNILKVKEDCGYKLLDYR